jgi:internalin A
MAKKSIPAKESSHLAAPTLVEAEKWWREFGNNPYRPNDPAKASLIPHARGPGWTSVYEVLEGYVHIGGEREDLMSGKIDIKLKDTAAIEWQGDLSLLLTLDLGGLHIEKLGGDFWNKLINLTELKLGANSITDLTPLSSLPNLRTLDLSYNSNLDFASLRILQNLRFLDLSHTNYRGDSEISSMTWLTGLMIDGCFLERIPDLSPLVSLQRLSLAENEISAIEGLDALVNLSELSLRSNNITNIPSLSSLERLDQLNLAQNPVVDMRGVGDLKKLKWIYLEPSQIVQNPSLEKIAQRNKINIISDYRTLRKMSY